MKITKTWWSYLDNILAVLGVLLAFYVIFRITAWIYFIIN